MQKKSGSWIANPTFDLIFFSFGWLLLFAMFFLLDQSGLKPAWHGWLLLVVLLVNFLHRQITFPLVYGDSEQFRARKKSYLFLPLLFLLLTTAALLYIRPASFVSKPIATPVTLLPGENLVLKMMDQGVESRANIRFSGREKSVEDLVLTFQKYLPVAMWVEAENNRLIFQYVGAGIKSSFSFNDNKNNKLFRILGLESAKKTYRATRPAFSLLIFLSVVWTMYHTLMQKVGILRIYSRKGGYGKPWLDKWMVFSWFIFIFIQLASSLQVQQTAARRSAAGKIFQQLLDPIHPYLGYLALVALAVAWGITFYYLSNELKHRREFSWGKNLFVFSILLLYSTFFYDFVIGYAIFSFSHAIEYLAFVNVFSRKKYLLRSANSSWLAGVIRKQAFWFGSYAVAAAVIFLSWNHFSRPTLKWFIVGSSFLHFLYDGWIWKTRNPEVGKPLGIEYSPQVTLNSSVAAES